MATNVVASRPPNSDRLQRCRSCQYVATVSRLKQLEKPGIQRTITDNNLMRRFALLRVQSGNDIIEKLVKPGTSNFFVHLKNCSTKFVKHILKKVIQGEILCRNICRQNMRMAPLNTSIFTALFGKNAS